MSGLEDNLKIIKKKIPESCKVSEFSGLDD